MTNLFAEVSGNLGYNIHARNLAEAMGDELGDEFHLIPRSNLDETSKHLSYLTEGFVDVEKPSIAIGYPQNMVRFAGNPRIGCTVWETTKYPEEWNKYLNQLDELWAVSELGKEIFEKNGVETNIEIVPEGVDYIFNEYAESHKQLITNKFQFLTVGKWERRKGYDILLDAFIKEFDKDEDVCLTLMSYNPFLMRNPQSWEMFLKNELYEMGFPAERLSDIRILGHVRDYNMMPCIYAAADAFVLPTRGEGWGLPIIEAMATGIPTIATDWGGHTHYFNEDNGYPIEVEKMNDVVPDKFYPQIEGNKWAEPDKGHLKELMREVFENAEDARTKAKEQSTEILHEWGWENAAEKAIDRIEELE